MTYHLRECEQQRPLCETWTQALPDNVIVRTQPKRQGERDASISFLLQGKGDLYGIVTDTLRASVPWDLWSAIGTHEIDRETAKAYVPRPLFGKRAT